MEIIYKPDNTVTIIDDNGAKTTVPNNKRLEEKIIELSGPAAVPQSVTPLQMRKAIRHAGLKATVDQFLRETDEEIAEAWEYATTIERENPFVQTAITGLGMADEQIDDLFRLAATL